MTVALINGQMLLVEGGKRHLDDVVDDLQSEFIPLDNSWKRQRKTATNYPGGSFDKDKLKELIIHQPEFEALQEEINILNEQLDDTKYEQEKQRRQIQTLKDASA